jgi:hypothetical protein
LVFRHELLFIFWALMEIALVTPLFLALTPWTTFWSPVLTALWLLLVMLLPFNLSRFISVLRVPVQRQQVIMVLALLATLLLSWRLLLYSASGPFDFGWLSGMAGHLGNGADPRWPRELALFVVTAFVWWRGIALAGRGVDYRDVGLRFRAGILLAVFLVAGLAGAQLDWSVTPFILMFLFTSLVSIVLTRVEQLELSRSGRSFPIGPAWLLTIMGVAAAVVFITGIIAAMVSGDSIGAVVGWFEPLWVALRFALAGVVSMLGVLISPLLIALIAIMEWVVGLFGATTGAGLEDLTEALQGFQQITPGEATESTELISRDYRQILTVLTMIFVILLVSLALGRLFRLARPAAQLESQSVSPFEGLGRPRRPGLGQRILDRIGLLRRWRTAASIRQTYRAMCAAAADRGFPRVESETPYEYLPTLARAYPGLQTDIELITESYIRVHYGELPESDDELQQILTAWDRLASSDAGSSPDVA